jgi:hypothetical protein
MENTYLTKVEDGVTKLYEVQYKSTIPQEVLMGVTRLQVPTTIYHDNRPFTHSVYTDGRTLTHVIGCALLYWQMPIIYNLSDGAEYIKIDDGTTDTAQQKIGIENITLIVHVGDNSNSHYSMFVATKNKKAALFTNVFDDGRLCFENTFNINTPVENIIATFESAPGNNHLLSDYETGTYDARDSDAPLYINKKDIVCMKVYDNYELNHEQAKYLRDVC